MSFASLHLAFIRWTKKQSFVVVVVVRLHLCKIITENLNILKISKETHFCFCECVDFEYLFQLLKNRDKVFQVSNKT